ncbi:MAG: hypothetical protein OXH76_19130 [Boseongicola sp.]|nr:hypothetical protein [Boseongicola sp.]
MVFLTPRDGLNDAFRAHMAGCGVVVGGGSIGSIRMVLHKDIDDLGIEGILAGILDFFGHFPGH